ncbi:MAG: hypothetical protein IPO81_00035 [Kouleothrix sp.]|nr:hypothetical protein [Kouleothrix sp.]
MASVFDIPELAPYRAGWRARCARYALYRSYYTATAYDKLRGYTAAQKLYAGTRALFSPLRRVVAVDCAKIPAAWALTEDAPAALFDDVTTLRRRLDAERVYGRFLKYGAVAGEAAIVVSGRPAAEVLTAHRPDEIVTGAIDGVPFGLIIKTGQIDAKGRHEWAQLLTDRLVLTFRDGKQVARQPNALGYLPVFFGAFTEGEDGTGEPAFAGVLELLDRVNEAASLTLDVITRNAEPLVVMTGVTDVEREDDSDALKIANEKANVFTVDPKLAIADTLAFIQDVRSEFKELLPQLRLSELTGASDLAYETVITLLQELGDHIVAVRSSVDRTIEQVERRLLGLNGHDASQNGRDVSRPYGLWRDRRWLTLTESQQLDLEGKRLGIEQQRKALEAPIAVNSRTPGA